MPRKWQISPHDEALIRQLSSSMQISPLMAQVVSARGYATAADAQTFLRARLTDLHDPELLPEIADAADRIVSAIKNGRRITIYGDYDVDGMTATTLLWQCFRLAGGTVDYYIPSRLEEGYGLNCDALRTLHEEDPNRLVVTVDCGIASVAEARLARELGLELIITDHHQMAAELPEAACLVHPRLPGSEYPFPDLCGAGVAFKLAWGVCQRLGDGKKASPQMREFLIGAVGLAAIATVADVVPLVGENRVIVRYGLESLANRAPLGLRHLMRIAKIESGRRLDTEDIGFALAPRLNAAGRLGQARLAVELMTTDSEERAIALARYLDELNKNRKTVERKIFKQAKELVAATEDWADHKALVLAHEDWHAGVIGIVASRVAEHFEKPAVLVSLDRETSIGQGSGRSYNGFDLHAALTACSDHLISYGGHRVAAGVKVRSECIDEFRARMAEFAETEHATLDEALLNIDAEVRLADCSRRAVLELDQLGPFGEQNSRPLFVASHVELAQPPRTMGEGDRHLSVSFRQYGTTMRGVAFGKAEWAEEMVAVGGPISICFAAGINRFRGRESVELFLKDWQPAQAQSSRPAPTKVTTS